MSISLPKHQTVGVRKLSIQSETAANGIANEEIGSQSAGAAVADAEVEEGVKDVEEEDQEDMKSAKSHGSEVSKGSASSSTSTISSSSSSTSKRMMVSENVYIETVEEDEA